MDYTATARSNSFRVKDRLRFHEWCAHRHLTFTAKSIGGEDHYALFADEHGWPNYDFEADCDIDIKQELARHLDARDVAVLIEIGADGLTSVGGYATAVGADGRAITLSLSQIFQMAREAFGPDVRISADEF